MWPKLFMQLFDLLPHAVRLAPVADKFFAHRSAADKAQREALAAMAEEVHGGLGQVTSAHDSLYRQLQEQNNRLAELNEEVRSAHTAIGQHERRVEALDQKIASMGIWLKGGLSVIVVLLAVAIWLLARAR